MFAARGFVEGNHSEPGHFVIEKASSSDDVCICLFVSQNWRPAFGK